MKFYYRFRIREQGFSAEQYKEICAMRPENRGKEDFIVEAKPGDEANAMSIKRIVDFCERHSVPKAKIAGEIGAYEYVIVRHYEKDDLSAAPLLILGTQKSMFRGNTERDENGRLVLPATQCRSSIKFGSSMLDPWYVASDSTRKVLESGHLAGLFFRETVRKGASISARTDPLWEIDSEIKLPKMLNAFLNPHSPLPCYYIDERPYRDGEPHYREGDLLPLGTFDIARTCEPLGRGQQLVISRHFYEYCLKNKIPVEVRPVRIDP